MWGLGGQKRVKKGVSGDGRRLGVVITQVQHTDNILQNSTPEIYIILVTNVTPINSVKKIK